MKPIKTRTKEKIKKDFDEIKSLLSEEQFQMCLKEDFDYDSYPKFHEEIQVLKNQEDFISLKFEEMSVFERICKLRILFNSPENTTYDGYDFINYYFESKDPHYFNLSGVEHKVDKFDKYINSFKKEINFIRYMLHDKLSLTKTVIES